MNNIAIIGIGYWGTIVLKNLRLLTKKKIFVYDKNKDNLINIKKKIPNIVLIKKIEDIYLNEKIKNIFLITPPGQNYQLLKKLILYKKNIFVEKPFLKKTNEANKILKLLKKSKTIFMVGYVYLFNQNILKIKKIIQNKELGKILFIKSQRENLGPIRTDVDCNYDLASHDISIISYLLNSKLKFTKVLKHKILNNKNTDISSIKLKSNNTDIEITTSWLNPEKVRKLIIIGSKKMLLFDEINSNNQIKIYNKYATYPPLRKLGKIIFSKIPKIYFGNFKVIKIKNTTSPLQNEIKHFKNSINKKTTPLTNINFSLNILKLLEKINNH